MRAAIFVWLLMTASLAGAAEQRLSLLAGGEVDAGAQGNAHGLFLLRYDRSGERARLYAELNTDTLRLGLDHIRLGQHWEAAVQAGGEALLAGLSSDYYRDGTRDAARGFWSSWVGLDAQIKLLLAPHYLALTFSGRRWFFLRSADTSPALVLPPDAFTGEARLSYTLWALVSDPSLYESQRIHPRLRGVAFGIDVGLELRSELRPWGARAQELAPIDLRNEPRLPIVRGLVWLRAGKQIASRVRVQLLETASVMANGDDVTRLRVGGPSAYSVPLAGAPWAGLVEGNLVGVEGSLHVRIFGDSEFGVLADGVIVADRARTGAPDVPGALFGTGVFADLRLGAWQVDVRAGWSPSVRLDAQPSFSALALLGWGRAWTR